MSRPIGSKNKKKKVVKPKKIKKGKRGRPKIKKVKKGKRGRPKGSKAKKVKSAPAELPKPTYKSYKYLGNCPKCKGMITSSDLFSKYIFVCKSCGKRDRTNKIKINKRPLNVYSSKKEYLESTMEVHHDIVPLNDKNELIDIKVIRVDH